MEERNHDILIELKTDIKWIREALEDYKNRMDAFESRFSALENKIERLEAFKWKLVGFAIGVSSIISFVVSLITIFHMIP